MIGSSNVAFFGPAVLLVYGLFQSVNMLCAWLGLVSAGSRSESIECLDFQILAVDLPAHFVDLAGILEIAYELHELVKSPLLHQASEF